MLPPLAALFLLGSLASQAWSWQILKTSNVPSYLSEECVTALTQDVSGCSPMVSRFINGYFYPESTLEKTCTASCAESLDTFEESIISSCGSETWDDYYNAGETGAEPYSMPVRMIPALSRYLYDLTCLRDSGRWCNMVAATAAMISDPGNSKFNWADIVANETDEAPSSCDMCFVKKLGMQAGSPFYEGPRLASMSLYQSMTSSCGVTGMPLTTSTLAFSTPASTPAPQATCTGTTYQVKAGDDCYSVSSSQGIGTAWLLSDNNLAAHCADFPTSGSLCLANTCETYVVRAGDTCKMIASAANITEPQFKAWNPVVDAGCYNLGSMIGSSVCVTSPGLPYVAPSVTITLPPTSPTEAVSVPGDLAEGSTTYCAKYYSVGEGDYCNLLSVRFGISLADFIILNPAVNENCTNLYAHESYCVQAVGDINTYPGQPGYHSATTTAAGPTTAYVELPESTEEPYARPNDTSLPLAERTRDDCSKYFDGSLFADLDLDTSGEGIVVTPCTVAADVFLAEVAALGVWNPSLGDASLPNCTFDPDLRYCGQLYFNASGPEVAAGANYELEVREGYVDDCTQFGDVPADWTCDDVIDYYSLTIAQFYQLNPAVGGSCENLWTGYAYCTSNDPDPDGGVSVPPPTTSTLISSSTASSTSASTATGPTPLAATQAGQPTDCNKWGVVDTGDGCSSLATEAGITLAQFYAWNPAVTSDCSSGLWAGYAYCIGRSSITTSTTPTTTTSAAPSPTATGPVAPGQTQAGQVSNCNRWDEAASGDSCWAISNRNSISLSDFYSWNTVLDGGNACGTSIWPEYYYCTGISPPGQTQAGQASNCNKWDKVVSGDSCWALADRNGISLDNLYSWNAVLEGGDACGTKIWPDYYYCIGVSA